LKNDFEEFVLKAISDHQLRAGMQKTLLDSGFKRGKADQILALMEISPTDAGREALNLSADKPIQEILRPRRKGQGSGRDSSRKRNK
jgi:hypothetical protein